MKSRYQHYEDSVELWANVRGGYFGPLHSSRFMIQGPGASVHQAGWGNVQKEGALSALLFFVCIIANTCHTEQTNSNDAPPAPVQMEHQVALLKAMKLFVIALQPVIYLRSSYLRFVLNLFPINTF